MKKLKFKKIFFSCNLVDLNSVRRQRGGSYSFADKGHGFINLGGQFGLGIEGSPTIIINFQGNYQRTLVAKPMIKF